MAALAAVRATAEPIVGAIRWDAYWGKPGEWQFEDPNYGIVTRTTTYDMSPKQWHYRVPFYGEEINETAITCDGNTQEAMGAELAYAAEYGIKFWSFCNYPLGCKEAHPPASECVNIQCCADNVGLSYAWKQYLAHPNRSLVNFTLLLQPGSWFPASEHGANETFDEEMARYVSYFKMPEYQTVLDGRPLVFIFGHAANLTQVNILRHRCHDAIGVFPYVVSMNGQTGPGVIDALASYASAGGTPQGASFQETIVQKSVQRWEQRKSSGIKVVPTVSVGWDPRPRYSKGPTPCPWGNVSDAYVTDPTMLELENFTAQGLDWVANNPGAAETGVMMLSAWNEHDEGHWIAPALEAYGGAEKLQAIKRAIDRHR